MPYVQVPDPLLNADKPIRSTDIKQMRDNQDYFNSAISQLTPNNAVSEHFSRSKFYPTGGVRDDVIAVGTGGANWNDTSLDYSDNLLFYVYGSAATYGRWVNMFSATVGNDDHYVRARDKGSFQLMSPVGFYFDNRTAPIIFQIRMKIENYTDWGTSYFGLVDGPFTYNATARPNNGIYCEAAGGANWTFTCSNGGANTVGTPFARPASSTWYEMEIEFTDDPSDQAICSIDGVTKETLTTNLPTAKTLFPVVYLSPSTNNTVKFDLDYFIAYASGTVGDAA